jgi:uncharacterized protein YidB (DUF937 family)
MGLMDVLNGMKNGPRGQVGSSATTASHTTGGMSPLTMGCWRCCVQSRRHPGFRHTRAATSRTWDTPHSEQRWPGRLAERLGGLISGGADGNILTGGLGELVKKFQQSGQGKIAQSWIGTGPNAAFSPNDLESAVGTDTLDALSQQTGMSRDQVLADLTELLPKTVDSLTPQGRVPSEHEASRWA